MALFAITRYLGDDEVEETTKTNKSQEEDILRQLRKEAELRKQAKQDTSKRKRLPTSDDEDSTPNKKKSKETNVDEEQVAEQKQDVVTAPVTEAATDDVEHNERIASTTEIGGFTILGEAKHRTNGEVKRVLPLWLSHPSVVSSNIKVDRVKVEKVAGLDEQMVRMLRSNGIKKFFPVQAHVIPALLRGGSDWLRVSGSAGCRPSDICCSAPTGSGKTLAYVVPIVQILKSRVVQRVRCLVVVPVGDLAAQVHQVFTSYCKETTLKVGLVTGLKPFVQEQFSLVKRGPRGYSSLCDILICTPGRLVDHITKTAGFDLSHLRFLVIDEADRVMEEIKQDWLSLVEKAVFDELSNCEDSLYNRSSHRSASTVLNTDSLLKPQIPLQKLLFSATLSQDPETLNQVKLFHPVLFTSLVKTSTKHTNGTANLKDTGANQAILNGEADSDYLDKFTTPVGLVEKFIESNKAQKPLVLLHLLCEEKFQRVLCFTNSVESTHRLYQLMKLIGRVTVKEFSSNLHTVRRNRILKQFAAGKIQLLISTDATARGIDVAGIDCVVSYDVPRSFTTYVHRVGRTARAAHSGTAFTLLEKCEIFHFKKLFQKSGKTPAKELKLKSSSLKSYVKSVTEALKSLPAVLQTEKKFAKNTK